MAILMPQQVSLGQQLGGSVSDAINILNQGQNQRNQRSQTIQALQSLGYAPRNATALSGLDQNLLGQVLKQQATGVSPSYQSALSSLLTKQGELNDEDIQAALQTPGLNEKQTKALTDVAFKRKGEVEKAFKETGEVRDEITKLAAADRSNRMLVERLEQLNNSDQLQNPQSWGNYIGSALYGATHPFTGQSGYWTKETQEFKKLQTEFLRNAKSIFGGRITNEEMRRYLDSIPSLSQSKEGRAQVLNDMKLMGQAAQLRDQAMSQIIRENNGIPPLDLRTRIEERIAPQLDEISRQYVAGVEAGSRFADAHKDRFKPGTKLDSIPKANEVPPNTRIKISKDKYIESNGYKWSSPQPIKG